MIVANREPVCSCANMEFSKKVVMLLERAGLNQAELARSCGIHPTRITELKKGEYHPPLGVALLMARTLGVSLDFLADPNQEQPPPAVTQEELAVLEIVRRVGPGRALELLTEPLKHQKPPPVIGESDFRPGPGYVPIQPPPHHRKPRRSGDN